MVAGPEQLGAGDAEARDPAAVAGVHRQFGVAGGKTCGHAPSLADLRARAAGRGSPGGGRAVERGGWRSVSVPRAAVPRGG
ncbi:hypothetical protein GCM10009802_26050 [Streptomyces synnematoformans]|uniref:Uncharacterized protein n=1 Tax=Streptomyces synnematoformans TaxID=415721 RepID=A0ABP5JYH0_9ACTN